MVQQGDTMIETELINVPFSGTGYVPLINIGGGHKGEIYVRMDSLNFESFYRNDNVDCIQIIFDKIDDDIFEDSIKRGIDLKKAIYTVMKEVWNDISKYSFEKCYSCFTDEPQVLGDDHCYSHTGWESEEYDPNRFPLTSIRCDLLDFCTFLPLKELDLRRNGKVSLTCKIKNIKTPVISHGRYSQDLIVYDDNTNKTIKATLNNTYADFDKWQKGDTVKLLGALNNDFKRPLSIGHIVKIKNEDNEIITNRNDETPGYNEWRQKIISRDAACVCCGHDKHLEAHHLFGYKENPSLAVNENNGVTLCKFCHDKYHSVYGVKDINPVDFMNFIKRFGVR